MKKTIFLLGLFYLGFLFSLAQYLDNPIYNGDIKIPAYLAVPDDADIIRNEVKTKDNAKQICKLLRLNEATILILSDTLTDIAGGHHETYKQLYKGIVVEGSKCVVHYNKMGVATMISGNLRTIDISSVIPRISPEQSKTYAKELLNNDLRSFNLQNQSFTNQIEDKIIDCSEGTLVIFVKNNIQYLAYKHLIKSPLPSLNKLIYLDANSGEYIGEYATICNASTYVNSVYSNLVSIETQIINGNYCLRDYTRGNGILTFRQNGNDYESYDNSWNDLSLFDRAAIDAHWGAEKTYDFYFSKFGRNSYDNCGSNIISEVNVQLYGTSNDWPNAAWNASTQRMYYGRYNGNSFASLDVTAHELTHAVTQNTSNLAYEKESGAINEGISDVFAVCVENEYKTDSEIWTIGEDITTNGLRDLSNPVCKYYRGNGWISTDQYPTQNNDYCGVHTNSGVFSYWFYLLAHGGLGINEIGNRYSVSSIGLDNAIQICYLTNIAFLNSNSTYIDARYCSLFAAQSLGYDSNILSQINKAWDAVGVFIDISGDDFVYEQSIYQINTIPDSLYISWSLSGTNASNFTLQENTPSTNRCTISRNENAVFSGSGSLTLTAQVIYNDSVVFNLSKLLTAPYIDGPEVPCGVSAYSVKYRPENSIIEWSTEGQGLEYYTHPNGLLPSDSMAYVINNDGSVTIDGTLTASIKVDGTTVGTLSRYIDELSFFSGTWYQQATATDTINSSPMALYNHSNLEIVPNRKVYLISDDFIGANISYTCNSSMSVYNWSNNNGVISFMPLQLVENRPGTITINGSYPSSCKEFRIRLTVPPTLIEVLLMNSTGDNYEFSINEEALISQEESRETDRISEWSLTIVDYLGNKVCDTTVSDNRCKISASDWKSGIYVAIAKIGDQYYSVKFNKK